MPKGTGRPLTSDEQDLVRHERANGRASFIGEAVDRNRERRRRRDEASAYAIQREEQRETGPRTNRERELLDKLYKTHKGQGQVK